MAEIGDIIRDHLGGGIASIASPIKDCFHSTQVELHAISRGFEMAKDLMILGVVIESDFKVVVSRINSGK